MNFMALLGNPNFSPLFQSYISSLDNVEYIHDNSNFTSTKGSGVIEDLLRLCIRPNEPLDGDVIRFGVINRGPNFNNVLQYISHPINNQVNKDLFEYIIGTFDATKLPPHLRDIYSLMKGYKDFSSFINDPDVSLVKPSYSSLWENEYMKNNNLIFLLFATMDRDELRDFYKSYPNQEYRSFTRNLIIEKDIELNKSLAQYKKQITFK